MTRGDPASARTRVSFCDMSAASKDACEPVQLRNLAIPTDVNRNEELFDEAALKYLFTARYYFYYLPFELRRTSVYVLGHFFNYFHLYRDL